MLDFFVHLEPMELTQIINDALHFAYKDNAKGHDIASNVIVYEEDVISDDGIRCKLVKGLSLIGSSHIFGNFYINDFVLLVEDTQLIDCSYVLHKFMLNKFGNSYSNLLNDLGIELSHNLE